MAVQFQDQSANSTPWGAPKAVNVEASIPSNEGHMSSNKSVEWYQPTVKSLPPGTVDFFQKYVGIEGEEAIKAHIYRVRDMAWKMWENSFTSFASEGLHDTNSSRSLPYPCIGLFRFLDFSVHLSPDYPSVVKRVQDGAVFLDLGCCFGQDIRKLAFDSGMSANLIGTDLEEPFLHLGYELFRDRGRLQATFVPGNVFADDFLEAHRGKVDIIYMASFLHLFNEQQQKIVVQQVHKLLRPRKGSMVFGRHLGADKGGHFRMESLGWDLYRHDAETIASLFQSGKTGSDISGEDVKWDVTSSLGRYGSANWDDDRRGWQGDETKQMMFTAVRL